MRKSKAKMVAWLVKFDTSKVTNLHWFKSPLFEVRAMETGNTVGVKYRVTARGPDNETETCLIYGPKRKVISVIARWRKIGPALVISKEELKDEPSE